MVVKEYERGISIVKDFKLLKIADSHRDVNHATFIPKEVIEAIDPEKLEALPIKLHRNDDIVVIGYVHNVRKTEEWFLADLKLMVDVEIEGIMGEEKIEDFIGVLLKPVSSFGVSIRLEGV
jgi:hypothetical protein